MDALETITTIIHVFTSIFLILAVLLQSGKGGGMGAAFGGGASTQIFGGRGAGNFLAKLTTGAAIIFMTTSLTLSFTGGQHGSVKEDVEITGTAETDIAADGADVAADAGDAAPGTTDTATDSDGSTGAETPETTTTVGDAVAPAADDASPSEDTKAVDE